MGEVRLTKELLARCQNAEMRALCALEDDVRETILEHVGHQQRLHGCGVWSALGTWVWFAIYDDNKDAILRLSPDTPVVAEPPEYDEYPVVSQKRHAGIVVYDFCAGLTSVFPLHMVTVTRGYSGILYRAPDGAETWGMAVDLSLGVPVKVRFVKAGGKETAE